MSTLIRLAKIPARALRKAVSETLAELRQLSTPGKLRAFDKLQLGAGPNPLPGWANIDLGGENLRWDLTRPLPLQPRSIRFVYSEHFIEHVTREEALMILRNCREAMVSGGVIRLSTPDLKTLVTDYQEGRLVHMEHGDWFPRTLCEMVNQGVRSWGHQYIYDEPELRAILEEAGFVQVERVKWRESRHPELNGLETRPDFSDLVMEATAP